MMSMLRQIFLISFCLEVAVVVLLCAPKNTASSVSIDLENSGNSYAKAVKQTSQTHPPFKPHLIKAAESKQLCQDLTPLNAKTLPSYSKLTYQATTF